MMIPNKDFRFRDDLVKTHKDTVPIELLVDPFAGIIFRYDSVTIKEEESSARLIFAYSFLELNGFDEVKLRENKVFEASLGNLLNSMILEQVDSEQSKTRTDNSEEPTKE
jgi:hypothetical protein